MFPPPPPLILIAVSLDSQAFLEFDFVRHRRYWQISLVQLRREEYGGLRANRGGAAADGGQRLISELFPL
jgi:hypothetical protein